LSNIINISFNENDKEQKYKELLPQLKFLLLPSDDLISNLSNCSSALNEVFKFLWVGFYLVKNSKLVLGPFQGSIACTNIDFGRGVCGKSYELKETIIVENVGLFKDHIACSALSKSEIVVPILKKGKVVAVIDIDSDKTSNFDNIDKKYLEELATFLSDFF